MSTTKCGICNDKDSKYKCPNCNIRYCGLACFKIHKETPCNTPAKTETSTESENVPPSASTSTQDSDPTIDTPQLSSLSISIPNNPKGQAGEPGPRAKVAKRMHSDVASADGEISRERLETLNSNTELVQMLQLSRLQDQINEILASPDPEASLSVLMDTAPEFSSFIQKMLHHLGLRDADGVSTM